MLRPIRSFEKSLTSFADLLGIEISETDVVISGMSHQSFELEEGDLFIALPGAKTHGAIFCGEAKARGAVAILTDEVGAEIARNFDLPVLVIAKPRYAAGIVSAWFYGEPMRNLYSVGITGTNGKTTTSTLLNQIWNLAGRESGLIGTIETRIGQDVFPSKRTTPESCDLQTLVATMQERQVLNLVMEVSSHAIALERMRGSHFDSVAFTNLTQDHLDFHQTMEEYFQAKAKLFCFEYAERAIINIDDAYGRRLNKQSEIPVIQVSRFNTSADWHFTSVESISTGFEIAVRGPNGILIEGIFNLKGDYNLDNALLAIALALESGVDPLFISTILPSLKGAVGRLESISIGQNFHAFVDYAHSPDAVARVLATCQKITSGKVIAVLGCGGDRDSSKRPLMGRALAEGSDVAIFTSDNPRSEDPKVILEQMTKGLEMSNRNRIIKDRKEAINCAVGLAQKNDVVIVLGKGHEIGQEVFGNILPFDDRLVLAEAIGLAK